MRTGILTILAYFVMCSVSYASDVYITQSGAKPDCKHQSRWTDQ